MVIKSLAQYASLFAGAMRTPRMRTLMRVHHAGISAMGEGADLGLHAALDAVAGYLCIAQDHGSDQGMGSFHLLDGWGSSYPETTGYIIPSLLELADLHPREDLRTRALRAADWLLTIQQEDGGWQGGRIGEGRPSVVFNTAQVVRGLMAAEDAGGGRGAFGAAAERACNWIIQVQEADGSWAKHNFLGAARVYDAYVSAPLLHMAIRTGQEAYRTAALRNLAWVLGRQCANGWFRDADNTTKHNDRPITHTVAYTIDGLLESFLHTGDERFLHAARSPAAALLEAFLRDGQLHGRYDAQWRGSEAPITTGSAQMAIVWARLHALTGEQRWLDGFQRMLHWLLAVQATSEHGPQAMQGALTGSFPLWGRYERFACPNWAQKYFMDALLCANGRLPRY